MADTKISGLPSSSAVSGDQIPIARSGANYRVSAASIAALATPYTLPTASTSVLGGVKVDGTTIVINGSGVISSAGGGSGTVTSVAVTVPTGLTVSGSPVTTSGTIALSLQSGYSIPTTASQTQWDSAYSQRLQWDGGSTNLNATTAKSSLGLATVASTGAYSDLTGTPTPYSLPTASTVVLGGVKVDGTTVTINGSGVISATGGSSLTLTTTGTSGVATYSAGTLNIPDYTYTLPTAAAGTLGGVKVGTGLSIDGSGVLSATATGTIGGSTGATDNAVLRADGTGGSTVQASSVAISDTGVVTGFSLQDTVYTVSDGASVDINPADGGVQQWTLGANRTFTASSFNSGASVILLVTAGSYTVTTPTMTWTKQGGGGTAPTWSTTGKTIVVMWKVGSTLYGSYLGDA